MSDERRKYTKKRRAELEEETRRRITESAVELHGTVGPAQTTMSAVAERAGVQRSTLYRHFPDEAALFDACSAHWAAANPPPDPTPWTEIADPGDRLESALSAMYAYYRLTEPMVENLVRDEEVVPSVKVKFADFRGYLDAVREILLAGWGVRGVRRQRLRAAIGHALWFETWRSLAREEGLSDSRAAELMRDLAEAAATPART